MINFADIYAVIVDDNPSDVAVLSNLLGRLSVRFDTFSSDAVLDALGELYRPDVIFLDLELPGMNGYEIFEALHSVPELDAVPIVAYTANTGEMIHCRKLGFHSFLGKPLRSSAFADQLERILSGQPVWETR